MTSRNTKVAALDKNVLKFNNKYWDPVCKVLVLLSVTLIQDLFFLEN